MTLSAIRARLKSLSPSKLAEIAAVSPCAAKILGWDIDKLLAVVEAAKRFVPDTRVIQWEPRELDLRDAFEEMEK